MWPSGLPRLMCHRTHWGRTGMRRRQNDSRIRVLHLITRLDVGGCTDNTIHTVLGHDKEKYAVTLAHGPSSVPSSRVGELYADSDIEVVEIREMARSIQPLADLKALISVYRILRNGDYQVLHTHCSKAGILGRLAAIPARIPLRIHTSHGHVFYGHFGPVPSWVFLMMERVLARFTDVLVELTAQGKIDHVSRGVGSDETVEVIHSGVDLSPFFSVQQDDRGVREEFGLSPESPIVGVVGWLTPIKGPTYIVEAWPDVVAQFPDAVLMLVGDGILREELEQLIGQKGLEHSVRITGMRTDVPRLMASMEMVVLPSMMEGMGKVLVEAMALGKPLVGTRVGGIPDLVQPGVNGILVPPRDPGALAEAIITFLSDPAMARACGEAGRAMAPLYSVEEMLDKIERLYARRLEEKGLNRLKQSRHGGPS